MQEILNNRSYNAKHFLKDDGKKALQAHIGHIHYKGTDNEFKDVDFALEDMGAYWQMVRASYKLLIAKDFGANKLIKFQNKYRGANHEIVYEPRMLAWVNNTDLSDFQVFRNQQSVTGYITGESNNIIRYDNAFGNGLHFEITLLRSGFKKEIVIEAKNKLELPPTANHKLVALFEYSGTGLKVKSNDKLRQWTSGNYFEEQDGFRIQEEANEVYQSFIRPAYIIDDGAESPTQEPIKVFWKQHNGKLYQAKVLPTQFLQNASYPVRADTTTEYLSGTNGDNSEYAQGSSWSTVRAATSGTARSSATIYCQGYKDPGNAVIERAQFVFDTSAIPETDTITEAKFYLHGDWRRNTVTGHSFAVYGYTGSDTPGSADFNDCGETIFSNSINQADWNTSAGRNNVYTLNASGISAVSKTGKTKLSLRNNFDASNTEPTDGELDGVGMGGVRTTGTTDDPMLEVTYGEASTFTPKIIMF